MSKSRKASERKLPPKRKVRVADKVVSWLRRTFPSSTPAAKLFPCPRDFADAEDGNILMGASFSVIKDADSLIESCTLFWAKGHRKTDLSNFEVTFFVDGDSVYHIIQTVISENRQIRRRTHFYRDHALTETWKFEGAFERLVAHLEETKRVAGSPIELDHPLLNPEEITTVRFRDSENGAGGPAR
jgi:hypothetical protein